MPNDNYFAKIKKTISDYAVQKEPRLSDKDVTESIKKSVADAYYSVGRKVEVISEGDGVKIIHPESKGAIAFKSVFAITKPQYLIERAKFHIEKQINMQYSTMAGQILADVIAKYQWVRFQHKGSFDKSVDLPELLSENYKQSRKFRVTDALQEFISNVQNCFSEMVLKSMLVEESRRKLLFINEYHLWQTTHPFSYLQDRLEITADDLRLSRCIFRRATQKNKKPSFKHIDMQITSQDIVCKPIKLNPEYDPETYIKTLKSTINDYQHENNYHLEETDIYEAIKCAVEEMCMTAGRRVILDISAMPPKLMDITNPDKVKDVQLTKIFAVIKPKYFLERVRLFIDRFEREKIFSTYMPHRGRIIKAAAMGETFFLGSRSLETIQVNKRFEGTLAEFGKKHNIYVESGKEKIVVYAKDYRMWDLATYIYEETGYAMSINSHRRILRLKKQGKDVIFNIFGTIGIMPADERIRGEEYTSGTKWELILYDVNQSAREGYQLYVSRKQIDFIVNYIKSFIPDFGLLKIRGIARDPGICSKILVEYNGSGRIKWGRYKESLKEIQDNLSGERIEIVEYDPDDMERTIQSALNHEGHIKINSFEKTATVVTTKKGALIGKNGYNVRLAGMLTGFKFTVMTPDEYLVAP